MKTLKQIILETSGLPEDTTNWRQVQPALNELCADLPLDLAGQIHNTAGHLQRQKVVQKTPLLWESDLVVEWGRPTLGPTGWVGVMFNVDPYGESAYMTLESRNGGTACSSPEDLRRLAAALDNLADQLRTLARKW